RVEMSRCRGAEDADGHCCGLASQVLRGDKDASHDATAKVTVDVTKNGRVCGFPKSREHAILLVWDTRCVDSDVNVEDSGVWRKHGGALQHVFKRQLIEPLECHSVREWLRHTAQLLCPKSF